jgi:hypothetical protein
MDMHPKIDKYLCDVTLLRDTRRLGCKEINVMDVHTNTFIICIEIAVDFKLELNAPSLLL